MAIKVAVEPEQIVELLTETVGFGITLIVPTNAELQKPFDPVIVYVVFDNNGAYTIVLPVIDKGVGETVNELAPKTVKVACEPEQIVAFDTVKAGVGFTNTVDVFKPLHNPELAEIVYTLVDDGLTTIEFVIAPVFHVYDNAPDAINVVLCPAQIVGLFTEIVILEPIVTDAVACAVHDEFAPINVITVLVVGVIV